MNLLIIRSGPLAGGRRTDEAYTQEFRSTYAERVIGNLVDESCFCTACGPECNACRKDYGRHFGRDIAAVIDLPPVLPYLLENAAEHVPDSVPRHDVLLAINVHEQVLLEFVKLCGRWGTRGLIVPLEAPDWVSAAARRQARHVCSQAGVEIDFPKPFCAFDPPAGSLLDRFRRRFCIGKPLVELTIGEGVIDKAHVHVSAACGATYYVARWLVGKCVDDDLRYEVIAKRMHSYPCTASMKWDEELGDTAMHVASQAHYEILTPLAARARDESPEMVASPLGGLIRRPVKPRENIENIERAKEVILGQLACRGAVSLRNLRKNRHITPAAMNSALLLLKQSGKIRTQGDSILPT